MIVKFKGAFAKNLRLLQGGGGDILVFIHAVEKHLYHVWLLKLLLLSSLSLLCHNVSNQYVLCFNPGMICCENVYFMLLM